MILAEPHTVVRQILREFLERHHVRVLDEAADGPSAVRLARRLRPDMVLLEVDLPGLNGIDATLQIVGAGTQVIALAASGERRQINQVLGAGASAYLTKWCTARNLMDAIQEVSGGRSYLCPIATAAVAARKARQRPARGRRLPEELTPREREVLQLLVEGQIAKEIAGRLGLSAKTVDSHRQNINRKLGTSDLAQLTRIAIQDGISPLLLPPKLGKPRPRRSARG